jgi:hypothetical protein
VIKHVLLAYRTIAQVFSSCYEIYTDKNKETKKKGSYVNKNKIINKLLIPFSFLPSLFCEWRRPPQDIDGSCEHIK